MFGKESPEEGFITYFKDKKKEGEKFLLSNPDLENLVKVINKLKSEKELLN